MAFPGTRVLAGGGGGFTDPASAQIAALVVDELAPTVPMLWNQAHPLNERWGGTGKGGFGRGVKRRVWREIDGGLAHRQRFSFQGASAVGGSTQTTQVATASLLPGSPAATPNFHSYAYFEPTMYAAWIAIGIEDELRITSRAAMFDYMAELIELTAKSFGKKFAYWLLGYGFVKDVNQTAGASAGIRSISGLASGIRKAAAATDRSGHPYGNVDRNTGALGTVYTSLAVTDGGGVLNEDDLNDDYLVAMDGSNGPTLGMCGTAVYAKLFTFAVDNQRIVNAADPTLGFAAPITYNGVPIMINKDMEETTAFGAGQTTFYDTIDTTGAIVADADLGLRIRTGFFWLNENELEMITWKGGTGGGMSPKIFPKLDATDRFVRYARMMWYGNGPVLTDPRRHTLRYNIV